jgi:hypothetical protein
MEPLEPGKAMNYPWPAAARRIRSATRSHDRPDHTSGKRPRKISPYVPGCSLREFRVLSGISILSFPAQFSIHSLATFRLASRPAWRRLLWMKLEKGMKRQQATASPTSATESFRSAARAARKSGSLIAGACTVTRPIDVLPIRSGPYHSK